MQDNALKQMDAIEKALIGVITINTNTFNKSVLENQKEIMYERLFIDKPDFNKYEKLSEKNKFQTSFSEFMIP